jgi:predicted nuclease with TOPRIM domain
MKDWRGHKHGEYDDECPICYLDRELDKAEDELEAMQKENERVNELVALQKRDMKAAMDRVAELEVELSDFQDLQLCDCCEGLFETCHDAEGHMQCERCTKLALRES